MAGQFSARSPAVKRLMREAMELQEPTELYYAHPLEDNLFEWHFTVRGPADTDFADGLYHGRIILPPEYPMKPPNIILLTPNGRFELNKKICLSISGYHPESWQPSWSIRTALLAIIGFMPTHGVGAIGSLDYTPEERRSLAKRSQDWRCQTCAATMRDVLPTRTDASKQAADEALELATKVAFQDEKEVKEAKAAASGDHSSTSSPTTTAATQELPSSTAAQQASNNGLAPTQRAAVPSQGVRVVPAPQTRRGQHVPLLAIGAVAALIFALLLRRLYMLQEWRFHSSAD